MKKFGKYEKQPEAKSVLLQTYLTSLLCMVLCVTMFFGTTYAWFTAEVNNSENEIYIGTLDVGLFKQESDGTWTDFEDETKKDEKLFDKNIYWEPGYTALESVQIKNKGQLAFRYELTFTDGEVDGEVKKTLAEVAQWFDVWCYHDSENTVPAPANYEQITEENGWTKVGSLDAVLNGKAVLQGGMTKEDIAADPEMAHTYTIALHMNGEKGLDKNQQDSLNSMMGQKISLNVKLVASQLSSEQDGFGNGNYDETIKVVTVSDSVGLKDALNKAEDGDVIVLAAGTYDLTKDPLKITKAITLQGGDPASKPELQFVTDNGDPKNDQATNQIIHGIEICSNNVTLKNLKLTVDPTKISGGNTVQISTNGSAYYSDIIIDGCEFSGSDHCIAVYGNNVTIQNCILDESTADAQGNILYVWGTTGKLTIQNNRFIGNNQTKHGISFYHQSEASTISGDILIESNTFENVYKGIVHEKEMTYTDVSVEILNNIFTNCLKKPVAIDKGTYLSYKVNGNVFSSIVTKEEPLLDNGAGAVVNADENYWDSDAPDWSKVLKSDKVVVNTYYSDAEKTNLVSKAN